MIANLHSLTTSQAEWQGVVRMRERMRQLIFSTFASDTIKSPAFGDILYNLPLLLAFDVLKQALLQVKKEEGLTSSSPRELDDLMDSAKTSVPWINWQFLREAVKHRKEVAQNGKLYGDVQCLQDIADIETQLTAWGIITAT